MQHTVAAEKVIDLYKKYTGESPVTVNIITAAGSPRVYFRLADDNGTHFIGTVGTDHAENHAFISLARHFLSLGLPVPEILAVSDDEMVYLQSDCGDVSLFEMLNTAESETLLIKAIQVLARFQTLGARDMDFSVCFPQEAFDERTVRFDLNYFKYCFLKVTGIAFDEMALQDDFDRLERILLKDMADCNTFMYRDFQSRNIMIDAAGKLTGIDFQGGRRGPREYDVASFLWQAKANFGPTLRSRLIELYLNETQALDATVDADEFKTRLPYFVMFRILQTLGAYGFRGIIEKRPHFLSSIQMGKNNLVIHFAEYPELAEAFPHLYKIAQNFAEND